MAGTLLVTIQAYSFKSNIKIKLLMEQETPMRYFSSFLIMLFICDV
jgi:hypothetical protein